MRFQATSVCGIKLLVSEAFQLLVYEALRRKDRGRHRTRLSPVYVRHRQSLEVGSPESLAIHLNDELLGRCRVVFSIKRIRARAPLLVLSKGRVFVLSGKGASIGVI